MATVLNTANRTGEIVSPALPATNAARGSFTCSTASLADPLLALSYTLEGEYGGVWRLLSAGTWLGGRVQPTNHLDPLAGVDPVTPSWGYASNSPPPTNVRLRVSTNKTARYSADLTVL